MRQTIRILRRCARSRHGARSADRHRRRAAGYVLFLGCSLLVTVVGLSAMMSMRIQRRTTQSSGDILTARHHAQSAVELGLAMIGSNANWRTSPGSGVWIPSMAVGSGTLTLSAAILADADADPDNNPVLFTGTGMQGQARQVLTLRVDPIASYGGLVVGPRTWLRGGATVPEVFVPVVPAIEAQ